MSLTPVIALSTVNAQPSLPTDVLVSCSTGTYLATGEGDWLVT